MNQRTLSKVFIWGFLFLYLLVAGISFCHAVQFFNIGNVLWMAGTLAFAFELGLALSLAAILLSDDNKKNKLPWILMIVLTFVQVVGNVYSTFKYISLSDVDYYIYLQKPLLFWIEEISQETVQVIISWIIGAILPIVALFMTDMVASNIKIVYSHKDEDEIKIDESNDNPLEETINVDNTHSNIEDIQNILNEEDSTKEEKNETEENVKEIPIKEEYGKEQYLDEFDKEHVVEKPEEIPITDSESNKKTELEVKEPHLDESNENDDKLQIEQNKVIPEDSSILEDSSLKEINNEVEFDEQDIPDFTSNNIDKQDDNSYRKEESKEENNNLDEEKEESKTYVQNTPKINRNVPNELITTSVKTI